jgi:hypothetical protein
LVGGVDAVDNYRKWQLLAAASVLNQARVADGACIFSATTYQPHSLGFLLADSLRLFARLVNCRRASS